jgi:hypothetical protein
VERRLVIRKFKGIRELRFLIRTPPAREPPVALPAKRIGVEFTLNGYILLGAM